MKNKKMLTTLLGATVLGAATMFGSGCSVLRAIKEHATAPYISDYGLSEEVMEKAVWVGSGKRTVGAIVGDNKVITVYHQDGIEKNDKYESIVRTMGGSFYGVPWVYITTDFTPKKTNQFLDVAVVETKHDLERDALEIADAKLGECLLVSLKYITGPMDGTPGCRFTSTSFLPYDRKGKITKLFEESDAYTHIKKGQGEIVMDEPRITNILPYGIMTWHHDPDNTLFQGDSGSLVIQDNKLVGILVSRNGSKLNVGYFTRGSELEKLIAEPKPLTEEEKKSWNPTLPNWFAQH